MRAIIVSRIACQTLFLLPLLGATCNTQPLNTPPSITTVALDVSSIFSATPGSNYTYNLLIENLLGGFDLTGTVQIVTVDYSDSSVNNAVAHISSYQFLNSTQGYIGTAVYKRNPAGYFAQLVAEGTNGIIRYVTNPIGGHPGWPMGTQLAIGDTFQSIPITFSDGFVNSTSILSVVNGIETISVPFGDVECFRIEGTGTTVVNGLTVTVTGTIWFNPKIGVIRLQGTNGSFKYYVQELVATNITNN